MRTCEVIKIDEELGVEYVVISELPRDEREDFRQWLVVNKINSPIIDNEGLNAMDCAFASNYYEFLNDLVHCCSR